MKEPKVSIYKPDTPRTDTVVSGNSDPSIGEYSDMCSWARRLEVEVEQARRLAVLWRDTAIELDGEELEENLLPWEYDQ